MSELYHGIYADDSEDKIHVVHKQDVQPDLEANKIARQQSSGRRYRDFERVA